MSDTQIIDTHRIVEDLRAAGFTKKQAEAQTSAWIQFVDLHLATKKDIADVQKDIADVRRDIEQLRADTKKDIAQLRADMTIKMLIQTGVLFCAIVGTLSYLQ